MINIMKEQFKILIFNISIYMFIYMSFVIRTKITPMDNIFSILMENLISPSIYIPDIIKTYTKYDIPLEKLLVILINQLFYTYFFKKYWRNIEFKRVYKFIFGVYCLYLLLILFRL